MGEQLIQELLAFLLRQADEAGREGGVHVEDRLAAAGMLDDHGVDGFGQVVAAGEGVLVGLGVGAAFAEDVGRGMDGPHMADAVLEVGGQRLPGGVHVGEQGVAAGGRQVAGNQD